MRIIPMKRHYLLLILLVVVTFELVAQDPVALSFSSETILDSVRIDNINNATSIVLKENLSILLQLDAPTPIENMEVVDEQLVYQNPFSEQLILNFHTTNQTTINLSVFDLSGMVVSQRSQNIDSGSHRFTFKPTKSGVFILKVTDESKTYNAKIICTTTSSDGPHLEYAGVSSPLSTKRSLLKSQKTTTPNDFAVAKDNMLRFTGYSNAKTNTFYDFVSTDKTYTFEFPTVSTGVYLNIDDSLLNGLDTIRCFASRTDYGFAYDLNGMNRFSKDSLTLKPVTYGGNKTPAYSWQINKSSVCSIKTSFYSTGILHLSKTTRDTAIITLNDEANNLSKNFVLIVCPPDFSEAKRIVMGTVEDANLSEMSGIVASVKNPGCFWVHNDSGDDARVFLINSTGKLIATVYLDRIKNRDWEDLTIGPGPVDGETYLYVGDFGDNNAVNILKYIYRFKEPILNTQVFPQYATLERNTIDVITYQYFDGNRDAETLMIDPLTKDLYVVTKRETSVYIYAFPYPQSITETFLIKKALITLPFRMTCGGDISADGKEILIKNLTNVYYWKREEGESVIGALSRKGTLLPYIEEPQGEAIGWLRDGTGYVTISEINNGVKPVMYLYKRRN